MLGFNTNYHNFALALDYLAFIANGLYRRSNFHCITLLKGSLFAAASLLTRSLGDRAVTRSLGTPCDSAFGKVVGGHLNSHLISGQYADVVHSQLAADVR